MFCLVFRELSTDNRQQSTDNSHCCFVTVNVYLLTSIDLLQIFVHMLFGVAGHGDTARAHVLQHAVEGIELGAQGDDLVRHTRLLHHGIYGVGLHDAGAVAADGLRDERIVQQLGSGNLEQRYLLHEYLIIEEVVSLHHVNLLLYLLGHLDDGVLVAPCGDGVSVYALDGRGRCIEALDVELATGKHGGDLIEKTSNVLRVND